MGCPVHVKGGPTFLQKVRFILRFIFFKCETPWMIYLEAGAFAFGNLAMALLFFDMADLTRSLFRPKGLRTKRHGPGLFGKNKKKTGPNIFPEPSDLIADTIDPNGEMKKPKWSNAGKYIWEIDTELQKQFNKIVFVNLINDFAYDWFSGILSAPQSKCDTGRYVGHHDGFTMIGSGWDVIPNLTDDVVKFPMQEVNNRVFWPFGNAQIVFAFTIKHIGLFPVPMDVQAGLRFWPTGDGCFGGVSGRETIDQDEETDLIVQCSAEGPATIEPVIFRSSPSVLVKRVKMWAFMT